MDGRSRLDESENVVSEMPHQYEWHLSYTLQINQHPILHFYLKMHHFEVYLNGFIKSSSTKVGAYWSCIQFQFFVCLFFDKAKLARLGTKMSNFEKFESALYIKSKSEGIRDIINQAPGSIYPTVIQFWLLVIRDFIHQNTDQLSFCTFYSHFSSWHSHC